MTPSKYGFSKPAQVIKPPKTEEELKAEVAHIKEALLQKEVDRINDGIMAVLHDLFDGRYPNPQYSQGGGIGWHRWEATIRPFPTPKGRSCPEPPPYFHITLGLDNGFYLTLDTNCLNDWYHREYPAYGWPTHRRDAELFVKIIKQVVGYPFAYIHQPEDPATLRAQAAEEQRKHDERLERNQRVGIEPDTTDHTGDPGWFLP